MTVFPDAFLPNIRLNLGFPGGWSVGLGGAGGGLSVELGSGFEQESSIIPNSAILSPDVIVQMVDSKLTPGGNSDSASTYNSIYSPMPTVSRCLSSFLASAVAFVPVTYSRHSIATEFLYVRCFILIAKDSAASADVANPVNIAAANGSAQRQVLRLAKILPPCLRPDGGAARPELVAAAE